MANRINYLKLLSQNKNSLISDIALIDKTRDLKSTSMNLENKGNNDVQSKMNQLLMLAEDPKLYY